MKKILLWLIKIYQSTPGHFHKNCRYIPTCSEYAYVAIERFGAFKGSKLAIKRLSRCRPGSSYGFDPVPSKE